jgi:hypothetical protein
MIQQLTVLGSAEPSRCQTTASIDANTRTSKMNMGRDVVSSPPALPYVDTKQGQTKNSAWSIVDCDELQPNWDGKMMTQAEFVLHYGAVDGIGLFNQNRARPRASINLQKLPPNVAADITEFLQYADANGGMTAERRAIVRQVLAPLEKQNNKVGDFGCVHFVGDIGDVCALEIDTVAVPLAPALDRPRHARVTGVFGHGK